MAFNFANMLGGAKWLANAAQAALANAAQKMTSAGTAGAATPPPPGGKQPQQPTGATVTPGQMLGNAAQQLLSAASKLAGMAQSGGGKVESVLFDFLKNKLGLGKQQQTGNQGQLGAAYQNLKSAAGNVKPLLGYGAAAAPFLSILNTVTGGNVPGLGMLSKGAGMLSNPFGTIAGMIMGPHPGQGLAGGLGAASGIASMFGMTQAGRLLGSASRLVGIGGRLYGGTGQIAGGFGQSLGGGETTAEQGLGGAFKGMQGLGTMLGPTSAGLALKVIGKFGETVVGSIEKLRTWNRELQQANFKFADFSASMAQVQAQQEVRRIQFEQERGESRATMAGFQSEQSMNLDKSLAGIEDVLADIKNFLSGTASMFMRDGIEIWKTLSGFIVVEWVKKQAEEKAGMGADADKMLEEASKQRWNEIYGRPDRFGGPGGGNRGI